MSDFLQYIEEQPLPGPLLAELIRTVLERGLPFRFQAGGSSMFPFIRDGDIVSIAPLPKNGPHVGDIAAFTEPERNRVIVHRVIVHRVVRKTTAGCAIQGDNCSPVDIHQRVTPEQLLGIVSVIERRGRQVKLGLGPERYPIAFLSRTGALQPLVRLASILNRRFKYPPSVPTETT